MANRGFFSTLTQTTKLTLFRGTLLLSLTSQVAWAEAPSTRAYEAFCKARPTLCESFDLKEFFHQLNYQLEDYSPELSAENLMLTYSDETLGAFFYRLTSQPNSSGEQSAVVQWMGEVILRTWNQGVPAANIGRMEFSEKEWKAISIKQLVPILANLDSDGWKTLVPLATGHNAAFGFLSKRLYDQGDSLENLLSWIRSTELKRNRDFRPFFDGLTVKELEALVPATGTLAGLKAYAESLWVEYEARKQSPKVSWNLKELFETGYRNFEQSDGGRIMLRGKRNEHLGKSVKLVFQPKIGRQLVLEGQITRVDFHTIWVDTGRKTHRLDAQEGIFLTLLTQEKPSITDKTTLENFVKDSISQYREGSEYEGIRLGCDWALVDAFPIPK